MSLIGQRVGPFEIVEPAVVPEPGRWWLARRAGNQRKGPDTVLVRVLDPDAGDAERGELQRSYDLLRSIDDPRVPEPVAYFEGLGALALDARVGRSLADAMAARSEGLPIGDATVIDLLLEVAETLQRVHHRNRVHGHLSAAHVVLARDGGVWIFGFGSPDEPPERSWAAPERLRGEPGTPATDQWGLAALAVALLTGRAPWDQPGAKPSDPDPSALVTAVEGTWPGLGSLLRRMFDPHPARRFANLHPVRQELLALARRTGGLSERRELAAVLHRREAATEEVVPALAPRDLPSEDAPVPPRSVVPAPARESAPATRTAPAVPVRAASPSVAPPEDAETPRQAPAARAPVVAPAPVSGWEPRKTPYPLPEEQIPVVRPHLNGDVPMAHSGRTTPAGHERRAAVPSVAAVAAVASAGRDLTAAFAEVVLEPSDPSSEVPLLEELTPTPAPPALPDDWPEPHLEESPTSPTVIPPTDPSEEVLVTPSPVQDAPSQHEDWFQSAHPTPAPSGRNADPSLGLSGVRVVSGHEPAVGTDDPPSVQEQLAARPNPIDTLPITRIAPVLAGTMLALVALWFVLRVI